MSGGQRSRVELKRRNDHVFIARVLRNTTHLSASRGELSILDALSEWKDSYEAIPGIV